MLNFLFLLLKHFNIGAHVCGFAGKSYQIGTNSKLNKITGLDPAGKLRTDTIYN